MRTILFKIFLPLRFSDRRSTTQSHRGAEKNTAQRFTSPCSAPIQLDSAAASVTRGNQHHGDRSTASTSRPWRTRTRSATNNKSQ